MSTMKHICGQCQAAFDSEGDYLRHLCPAIGATPQRLTPSPKPQVASLLEKKVLAAVQAARQAKK